MRIVLISLFSLGYYFVFGQLPSSGQISLNDIRLEQGLPQSNVSLRLMSATAGFSQPDAISKFHGWSSVSEYDVEYLVVGGGGGASSGYGACDTGAGFFNEVRVAGGGGAGGVLTGTGLKLTKGTTYTITVGSGGGGGNYFNGISNGGSSSIYDAVSTLVEVSGGGRGGRYGGNTASGGGSGGGGWGKLSQYGYQWTTTPGAAGIFGQGSAGGNASRSGYLAKGGAGGSKSLVWYGNTYGLGGSSGHMNTDANGAHGASGTGNGGSAGQSNASLYGSCSANTAWNRRGGNGGSGTVILKMPDAKYSGVYTGMATVTSSGGITTITFTSSGTYKG